MIEQYALQHHRFYTTAQLGFLIDLYSTPPAKSMHFFQSTMALGFYYSIIPKPFVTTASKFNSSRKFSSLLTIIPLQPPLSLNFAIHTFLVFVHGEIQSYTTFMNTVFSRYFRNVFIVFIISFCLCLFLVQNTVPFEKLNSISLFLSKTFRGTQRGYSSKPLKHRMLNVF